MVEFRRSFFRQRPRGPNWRWYHVFYQWFLDAYENKFLFWAIMAGFITIFPTLYIPVINHNVFKHTGISWEWGIVIVEAILFFAGCEFWKLLKRVWFRRQARKQPKDDLAVDSSDEQDMEKSDAAAAAQMAQLGHERASVEAKSAQ